MARTKLTRMRRGMDDQPRYFHPDGYLIRRQERDWSIRGYGTGTIGMNLRDNPKVWWEAKRSHRSTAQWEFAGYTLSEAVAFCDAKSVWTDADTDRIRDLRERSGFLTDKERDELRELRRRETVESFERRREFFRRG